MNIWGEIDKEDRQEDIKNRINNGRAITAMLNSVGYCGSEK